MNDNALPNPMSADFTRREFLKSSSFGAAMTMLGGIPLMAEAQAPAAAGRSEEHTSELQSPC